MQKYPLPLLETILDVVRRSWPTEIIDAVLNHVKKGIIRTYNRHDYDNEKWQALEALEHKLLSITTGARANVVSIGSRMKPA